MKEDSPIIFIDDDEDDHLIYQSLLKEIVPNRPVLFFLDGEQVLEYLRKTGQPSFLIISDVRLPRMDGLELRQAIQDDPNLKRQAIPFVFFTQTATREQINRAYDMNVQGFFEKRNALGELRHQLQSIINYWTDSLHPNRLAQGD